MARRWIKKPSALIKPLWAYVRPTNEQFVKSQAEKRGISYSEYVDTLITRARERAKYESKRAA